MGPINIFNKRKYRSEIFKQMAFMTGACFVLAFILSKAKIGFIHNYKKDYVFVSVIALFIMFALMIYLGYKCKEACEKNQSKIKQYGFAYAFVFLASLSVSGALIIYKLKSAIYSFAATFMLFGFLSIYAKKTKDDIGKKIELLSIFFLLFVTCISLCIFNIFIGSSLAHTVISLILCALISLIGIFNLWQIDGRLSEISDSNQFFKKDSSSGSEVTKGVDNTNQENKEKIAENLVPYAALCIFSQIIDLFLQIIVIIGQERKGQDFKVILNCMPNLNVGSFDMFDASEAVGNQVTQFS